MENIQERISEIKAYLVDLKSLAKSHLENKRIHHYKTICECILFQEKSLRSITAKNKVRTIKKTENVSN